LVYAESQGIDQRERIAEAVSIEIEAFSIGVGPQIPAGGRIIITVEVVVEAGLGVVVLPWEAQVAGDHFNANLRIAERVIGRRPDNLTATGNDLLRSPLVVVLVPVVLAAYLDKERIGSQSGLRRPAIGPQLRSGCVILTDQTFGRVYKIGPDTVNAVKEGGKDPEPTLGNYSCLVLRLLSQQTKKA
jgi:hypothetical protein